MKQSHCETGATACASPSPVNSPLSMDQQCGHKVEETRRCSQECISPPSEVIETLQQLLLLLLYCEFMTMHLSGTVMEIWHLKDNGVTTLTFRGHVTSSVT